MNHYDFPEKVTPGDIDEAGKALKDMTEALEKFIGDLVRSKKVRMPQTTAAALAFQLGVTYRIAELMGIPQELMAQLTNTYVTQGYESMDEDMEEFFNAPRH